MPVNWQLPPGVTQNLWDHLHDADLANNYDGNLAGASLANIDQAFCDRFFVQPGRLIDLGCGTGRLLLPFAHRGFWTLGVDLSTAMLAKARFKAAAAGLPVHLLQANLVDLACLECAAFDYAACLFSTLGMVAGAAHRRQVLAHIHRLLKPGGRCILHVHNRWFNFWNPQGRRWLIKDWLRSWLCGRPAGDHHAPAHQGLPGLALHLFTRREAIGLLTAAGFRILEVMPVSLRPDGRLPCPWWFGRLRAYGYLLAAEKP